MLPDDELLLLLLRDVLLPALPRLYDDEVLPPELRTLLPDDEPVLLPDERLPPTVVRLFCEPELPDEGVMALARLVALLGLPRFTEPAFGSGRLPPLFNVVREPPPMLLL